MRDFTTLKCLEETKMDTIKNNFMELYRLALVKEDEGLIAHSICRAGKKRKSKSTQGATFITIRPNTKTFSWKMMMKTSLNRDQSVHKLRSPPDAWSGKLIRKRPLKLA